MSTYEKLCKRVLELENDKKNMVYSVNYLAKTVQVNEAELLRDNYAVEAAKMHESLLEILSSMCEHCNCSHGLQCGTCKASKVVNEASNLNKKYLRN